MYQTVKARCNPARSFARREPRARDELLPKQRGSVPAARRSPRDLGSSPSTSLWIKVLSDLRATCALPALLVLFAVWRFSALIRRGARPRRRQRSRFAPRLLGSPCSPLRAARRRDRSARLTLAGPS
jgi:hypothetical protein